MKSVSWRQNKSPLSSMMMQYSIEWLYDGWLMDSTWEFNVSQVTGNRRVPVSLATIHDGNGIWTVILLR